MILDRSRASVFLANLLIGAGMFGMNLFMTYFLQVNLHCTPLQAGCAFLPFSVGIIATTTLGAPLVTRLGPKTLMAAGSTLATAGLFWLTRLDTASGYAGEVLPTQILVSVGVGLFFLAGPNVALSGVDPHDAGVASAALSTSQQIGAALGPALLNTLYVSAVIGYRTSRSESPGQAPPVRAVGGLPPRLPHRVHRGGRSPGRRSCRTTRPGEDVQEHGQRRGRTRPGPLSSPEPRPQSAPQLSEGEAHAMDECIREIHAANDAAGFWEQLYRGKGSVWKDTANPLLAETARHLTPGHALDLGCGEGGDTRWLATHEWHVTAVDIAPTALQRTSRLAARNGLENSVRTEQHDLAETFPSSTFDLISAQYLQTPYAFPRASVLRRAAHALRTRL
ncbi:MFS transporter [Streptomyces hygroscopicus]|uniref:MFS transporter n=1 Tax=Streptomyces hygroscopicus TaxID=1912 RepID=UPI000767CD15|nr:MFS transporter [Streptomyces hygroscopicus]